jgi:hypothetical protein
MFWHTVRIAFASCFIAIFLVPSSLFAETHLVSPSELQQQVLDRSQTRQQNIQTLDEFLSSPAASKAMSSAHVDSQQVKTAVSTLSDGELAQLSARAQKAQDDFAAGRLDDRDLLLIIVGILALILIIVAVR